MNELIACCGLNCEDCDARKATINNDDVLREKTAKLWSELNNCPEITPGQINCMGCRTQGVKTVYCGFCEIRNCVNNKGFNTCGECPEMGCCLKLEQITKNNGSALENLRCER
ncbi:MAG: DUF3795 domain-containing protein [Candidatus Limimorpha sp.]